MLVILFALWAGQPEPVEIASVVNDGACQILAEALNKDPEKPAEVKFGCYKRAPGVKA